MPHQISKRSIQRPEKKPGRGYFVSNFISTCRQFAGWLERFFAQSRNALFVCITALVLGSFASNASADVAGDYRSLATGNWSTAATWETFNGTSWVTASTKPAAANNVFIQAGHTVTLTGSEACNDLHISTGTINDTTGGDGQVALGANTLEISGKVRCYTGTVGGSGNLPGASSALSAIGSPITMTAASAGKIRFVGNTRTIFNTGEWSSSNTGATTTYATEIALNSGQTATAQTVFKTSALTVTSGTLSCAAGSRVGIDNGTTGQGNVTIASGAVLSSAGTGASAGNQVMSRGTATRAGTLTINSGGKLVLSGNDPRIDMNAYVLNGTVEYTGGTQNLLQKSGQDASAVDISTYANLTVNASGAKTLPVDTTVNGILALTNGTLAVSTKTLILNGPAIAGTPNNLTTTSSSSLSFGGSSASVSVPGSVAALNNLTINNANGVALNGNTTISGILTLTSGAFAVGANVLVLNGPAIAGTPGNLTTTSASTLAFGGSSAGVSVPSSVTALNNLIIANSSGVTLNAALTIAASLKINSGTLALNYSGTANIGLLSFDSGATWQATGTYGFTGSGATTIDTTHFATSATLGTVTVGANAPTAAQLQYFRSKVTGNWDAVGTWESSLESIDWFTAAIKPGSVHNVFIQAGHTVTLTGNEACNDLHISTGTVNDTTGGDGQVALAANTLQINGKLRCYFGAIGGSLPGTSSALVNNAAPITMTAGSAGKISFVGNTRTIFNTGEWSSSNTGATTTYATEIAMNSGQIATVQTVFKTSALTVGSGTLNCVLGARVGIDNGTAGQGDVTIASGAVFSSANSGTPAGNQVISRGPSTTAGTMTINSGGKLQISGADPRIDMSAYNLNGTVEYNGVAQNLLQKSGQDAAAVNVSTYTNLILSGTLAKTLAVNTTVNGTLTMAGSASLALGAFTLTYGVSSTLAYAGSAAQTTANTEFPTSSGPNNLTINNTNGVALNSSKTINGTLTVNPNTTLDFNSQTVTAGATVLNGTLTMEINKTGANTFTGSKLTQSSGTLTYGGTLNVMATGSALAGGDVPVLFNAASYSSPLPTSGTLPGLPVQAPALNWYLGSLTNNGSIIVNRAPVAQDISMGAQSATSATLQIINGKYAPTDADGNTLLVSVIQNPSTQGGAVATDGTNITYTAVADFTGTDTFTYTVSDRFGGFATNTITANVVANGAGFNLLSGPISNGDGTATINYLGVPSYSYALDTTPSLTLPITWTPVITNTAGTNGQLSFTFSTSDGQGYFRTRYVP
jgi:hypothetical protein